MKAVAIPPENAHLILILYDDSTQADSKVIEWTADRLNELFQQTPPAPLE